MSQFNRSFRPAVECLEGRAMMSASLGGFTAGTLPEGAGTIGTGPALTSDVNAQGVGDPRVSAPVKDAQQDYFYIVMTDALISSYSLGGIDTGLVALPTDPEPAQVDYFLRLEGMDGESGATAGARFPAIFNSKGTSNTSTPAADDVWIDGRIITAENAESSTGFGNVLRVEVDDDAGVGMLVTETPGCDTGSRDCDPGPLNADSYDLCSGIQIAETDGPYPGRRSTGGYVPT
jgi:hypothetical protein